MAYPTLSQDEHGAQLALLHPQRETPEKLAERIRAVRDVIAKDCTEQELYVFAIACQRTGLDPFSRQIYAIKRKSGMTIQTGIDGFRAVADDSDKYQGQIGPFWCGEDGVWKEDWLSAKAPVAAKVGVYREGFRETLWAVARTEAYRVDTNDLWRKMPEVMIAKCAEALALRKAFPKKLSDVYTTEEMHQADAPTALVARSQPRQARVVEEKAAPKQRVWKSLQARAHAAQCFETAEEWEQFVWRTVEPTLDEWASFKPSDPKAFDAVEQAIADKEAENAAAAEEAGEDGYEGPDLHNLNVPGARH